MSVLIGATGFVGGHLARAHPFDQAVHRPDVHTIAGSQVDLLVCAGLPAEKWRANREPAADWQNMAALAQVLATVRADRAVLISTVDVYQPAVGVDEGDPPDYGGPAAYGMHRAWFEAFFRATFGTSLVLRLPGLYAPDLRKNLIYDLMHDRHDQWAGVNPDSTFQFFDVRRTWELADRAMAADLDLVNVATEPVSAAEVAAQFDVELVGGGQPIGYDLRTRHAALLGGEGAYLVARASVLAGIAELAAGSR